MLIVLGSLVIGGVIGSALGVEAALERFGRVAAPRSCFAAAATGATASGSSRGS